MKRPLRSAAAFVFVTTRYNRDYWLSVDGLGRHYERADVDAERTGGGASYGIKTESRVDLIAAPGQL